ncbi:hypothetical protein WDU94_013485 [Cyamophila willieti]
MKDPNLAALAEYGLGYGNLRKFVVNTREDEKELKLIMDRVMPPNVARLPVTCAKFVEKPFSDIREAHYNNVFSNLEIEDPVVSNILIELTNCQGTILIEDNKTALTLLSNPRNVPANTVLGYTPDGSKHFPNTGRSVYKTYQGNLNSKVPRFVQTEQTTLIRELTNEIKQLKSELASMQQDIRVDEKELMRCQHHEREVANQLNHLVSKMKKLQDDLNRSVVDEESKLAPLDLYKEEYSNNLRDIDKCETELKQNWEAQKVIKTSIKQLDDELAELAPKLESDEVTKMAEVEEMKTNLVRFKSDTGTWQSKLKEANTKVEHLTKRLDDQSAMIDLYTKEAEGLTSRDMYSNPRPISELEEEIIEVQNLLERAENMGGGNPLELEAAISERLDSYEMSRLEWDLANSTALTIDNCLKRREKGIDKLLEATITTTKIEFKSVLAVRGFTGKLKVDINNKSLDIHIMPKDKSSQLKDTASLSGGEKSYGTVAFIMALWKGMKSVPFFSMDEFDVFMDSVSRDNIIKLVLGENNIGFIPNRQFLFLTPLDCSFLVSSPNVTIHKMLDPQRHNFMSQG